ncbi:hypothetical protein [Spongiactinospora sp. 9N601]|uniref:hypothetical protein n=1 Tax=Spongiactinospora sp. 9N601 TaxID=3375149 RepID=UPI0037B9E660
MACDICGSLSGAGAKRYSAAQLQAAVNTGYRPSVALEQFQRLAKSFDLSLPDDYWYGEWVAQVRRDKTDWLLCWACRAGIEHHLDEHGAEQGVMPTSGREPIGGWEPASRAGTIALFVIALLAGAVLLYVVIFIVWKNLEGLLSLLSL